MSSKDRKHSSKDKARKHQPTPYGDRELTFDKDVKKSISKDLSDKRESSSRRRNSNDKDVDLAKEKLERNIKKKDIDEHQIDKREKMDKKRQKINETETMNNLIPLKVDKDSDDKRKKHRIDGISGQDEKRQFKLDLDGQQNDKKRSKRDTNDSNVSTKIRIDKTDDKNNQERHGSEKDREKRKHRSDKIERTKTELPIDENKGEKSEIVNNEELENKLEKNRERKHRSDKERLKEESSSNGSSSKISREKRKENEKHNNDFVRSNRKTENDNEIHIKYRLNEEYIESNESIVKTMMNIDQINQDTNYDDDEFENYDDEDFEDDNQQIFESSEEDQKRNNFKESVTTGGLIDHVANNSSQIREQLTSPTPITNKIGQIHSSFINFKIAQKKCSHDVIANKMLCRAYDLSRLIDLDRVDFDILEIAPVLEHDQYMRLFAKEGSQQEGCQTGDDNICREAQTETIEERIVWTQYPELEDDGGVQVVYDSRGDIKLNETKIIGKPSEELTSLSDLNNISISHILGLMETVLDEEASSELSLKIPATKDGKPSISSGYNKYLISEEMTCIISKFSQTNSNLFVTIQQKRVNDKGNSDNMCNIISSIAVWKVSANKSDPYIFLTCPSTDNVQSSITCVSFSPDPGSSHVICGLNNGAIGLWDLREYSINQFNEKQLSPSYLTGFPNEDGDIGHDGPIVAIQCFESGVTTSTSYQLISIDSFAKIFIWIVSAVAQCGKWLLESGSLTDLHLRPGSKYLLNKMSSMSLISDFINLTTPSFYVTTMVIDPTNNCNVIVGTNGGQIMQHTRSNRNELHNRSDIHPKILGESDSFQCSSVTQLDFYPFFEPFVLAGYGDGLIRIFVLGKSKHLLSFYYKQNIPILQLKWSRSHPAIFFSLDAAGNLCIWNVLINEYQPVHVQRLPGYIGFDLSTDSKWHHIKDKNSINNKARLLLWALDGRLEVHDISEEFSCAELDTGFKTCSFFQSLM